MSTGPGFGGNQQWQVSRRRRRGSGGCADLAAFQLWPPADLEQELQYQAKGDQCCPGLPTDLRF